MGMFDCYEPKGTFACPNCGKALSDWQSKEGPCLLNKYVEGHPVELEEKEQSEFYIYTSCDKQCMDGSLTYLKCLVAKGVWVSTEPGSPEI